ncbi:MAG TPA: TRAP transporter substrate-binding protein DctP [Polyangia bacterium]|nr:TRAP transporter substrate-binding protein DctP [Polyangia bacterium]
MARPGVLILLCCLGLAGGPRAPSAPITLRMAAIAPENTPWARMLTDFTDEVERATHGQLRIKWILNGAAGDEQSSLERVRNGELSGLAGAIFCQHVAPSLHAIEVAGLVESDDEASLVLQHLRPKLDEETRATPFVFLALGTGFGHRVLFSREPVRTFAELKTARNWSYDLDEVERSQLALMGIKLLPLPIDQAGAAYDQGRVDGFLSVPAAAVAFRYGVKARYFTDLHSMFLPGCLIISRPTFESLDGDAQRALKDAGDRLAERFNRLGRQQEDEMLSRAFPREGLRAVPMSDEFRREYLEAARAASARLGLIPLPLVRQVNTILAEARAPPRAAAK